MNHLEKSLQTLIEQEIFDGRPYGLQRLIKSQESRVKSQKSEIKSAETPRRRQAFTQIRFFGQGNARQDNQKRCIKLCDANDSASQKRVENCVDSSAQVLIDLSEIQGEEAIGERERFFP